MLPWSLSFFFFFFVINTYSTYLCACDYMEIWMHLFNFYSGSSFNLWSRSFFLMSFVWSRHVHCLLLFTYLALLKSQNKKNSSPKLLQISIFTLCSLFFLAFSNNLTLWKKNSTACTGQWSTAVYVCLWAVKTEIQRLLCTFPGLLPEQNTAALVEREEHKGERYFSD